MNDHLDTVGAERKAKRFWVTLVVGLLGIQLAIGYVAIRLAVNDPTVAIVPDYHEAALRWDEHRSALTAAERLGLKTQLDVSRVADTRGQRAIVFMLSNADGQPLSELDVNASVYRHARASEVQSFPLASVGEGKFMASLSMPDVGLWQISVEVAGAAEPILVTREFSL